MVKSVIDKVLIKAVFLHLAFMVQYDTKASRGKHHLFPGNNSTKGRGRLKNAHELLNRRVLKILMLYKNKIFECMGQIFCFEIPHKLFYSYIERYKFHPQVKI